MSEAVAAFGLAASIIQVISFTWDFCSACKSVYDGRPTKDTHREDMVKLKISELNNFLEHLKSFSPLSDDKKALIETADQCERTATKLLKEARMITAHHQTGSKRKSFKAIYESWRRTKKISRLQAELRDYEAFLETQLLKHVW